MGENAMVQSPHSLPIYGNAGEGMPAVDWDGFRRDSAPQTYPAGVELLQQDRPVGAVHLINRGMVKLLHLTRDGNGSIVGLRPSGSLLGAASALLDLPSILTAVTTARTDTSIIPAGRFRELIALGPIFCAGVCKAIALDVSRDAMLAIERY